MPSVLNGALLGLSIAVPFGPVSLVCVQRCLSNGIGHAIASGFGAATAQGLFCSVAIAGASAIAVTLAQWHVEIHLASACVLILLGLRTAMRRSGSKDQTPTPNNLAAYGAGLLLALSNPMTILPYVAVAGAAALVEDGQDFYYGWTTVLGVMLGATSWYIVLSTSTWWMRGRLPQRLLSRLNWLSGGALVSFGVVVALN